MKTSFNLLILTFGQLPFPHLPRRVARARPLKMRDARAARRWTLLLLLLLLRATMRMVRMMMMKLKLVGRETTVAVTDGGFSTSSSSPSLDPT